MKNTAPLFITALLITSPLVAQEDQETGMPQPAKELAKLSRLIGHFKGEGTVKNSPDLPASKWTSITHCRKVLGGHFLREDVRIDTGEETPAPLMFRTFYGVDSNNKRFMHYSIGNMGNATKGELTWSDDDTLISANSMVQDGKRVIERWTTSFTDDGYTVVGHKAVDGGDFFVCVQGSMKRVSGKPEAKIMEASDAYMVKAAGEMAKLKPMVGKYRFAGEMCVMPSMPMQPISGTSNCDFIFSGTILETTIHGDPAEGSPVKYEGWCAMAWNARDKCYVSISVSNMGEACMERAHWQSKTELLFTGARPYYGGIPSVHAGVMKCTADGNLASYSANSVIGIHKPLRSFHITYTKQQ